MPASKIETRARKLPSNVWQPGQSGNPHGRPKAPVDIAELARQHGPRCIAVAVKLLDDVDARIRLGALTALLDRGYGRPVQAITSPDGASALMLHFAAATAVSRELQDELQRRGGQPTISGIAEPVEPPPEDLLSAPLPEE
jgi:hypothetical protein